MAIMMLIINQCLKEKIKCLIVSHSYPHLARGVIEDYKTITRSLHIESIYNKQEKKVTFINESSIDFLTSDKIEGVKGTQYDISFINEANYVSFDFFNQVLMRSKYKLFIDFNPVQKFWAHDLPVIRNDAELIKLTYKDNEAIPEEIKNELKRIDKMRNISSYWANYAKIYVDGEIGGSIDCVFPDWLSIKEVPEEAKLISLGVDFGFTNDVTAIVALYYIDNTYIVDEIAYSNRMLSKDIAEKIKEYDCPVYCDNAEPRTIAELNRIIGYTKCIGVKYRINETIDIIKQNKVYVTEKSVNIQKEQQNYIYIRDKATGELTNVTTDKDNHAIDAIRYAFTPIYNKRQFGGHKVLK